MNIFVLDYDPKICAQYHCDKHVVKMITESVQLLSTAARVSGIDKGYAVTHVNHPCSKWARESWDNWLWLNRLAFELEREWKYRYDHPAERKHKAIERLLEIPKVQFIPSKGLTPFAQCMPDEYKSDDVIESYKTYYLAEKAGFAKWKKRDAPDWWTN